MIITIQLLIISTKVTALFRPHMVLDRSNIGTVSSNPARGMIIRPFFMCYAVLCR